MSNEPSQEEMLRIEKGFIWLILEGEHPPLEPELFENSTLRHLATIALEKQLAGEPIVKASILANIDRSCVDTELIREFLDYYTMSIHPTLIDENKDKEILYDRLKAKNLRRVLERAERMFREGYNLDQISDFIEQAAKKVQATGEPAADDKTDNFIENLFNTALDTAAPDGLIGFPFEGFNALTTKTAGLQQGLYLIGAETNIGKTTMLSALALAVLDSLPVIIFSLDDSKEDFAFRLASQLTGEPINDIKASKDCSKQGREGIEKARDTLSTAARENRFALYDVTDITGKGSGSDFDRLKKKATSMAMKAPDNGIKPRLALCIDGLYNLDTGSQAESKRTENIDRAQMVKTLADDLNLAVICTVETKKKEPDKKGNVRDTDINDIMETGKYAYNANVVFILNTMQGDETGLKCTFAKNKRSPFKGNLYFRFEDKNKAKLIEDTTHAPANDTGNDGQATEIAKEKKEKKEREGKYAL